MSKVDTLDIYEKFANFFELTLTDKGKIYEHDYGQDEILSETEWGHSILYLGKRYSWLSQANAREMDPTLEITLRFISKAFEKALKDKGYWFRGKYIAYLEQKEITQPHRDIFRIYDGFTYRILSLNEHFFLCIDPHLVLRFIARVDRLLAMGLRPDQLSDFSVSYKKEGVKRIDGYLLETTRDAAVGKAICRVKSFREEDGVVTEELVDANITIPEAKPELIQKFLADLGGTFDVVAFQRKFSFLDSPTPSRDRFARTLEIVSSLQQVNLFPLQFGVFRASLSSNPVVVKV